MESNGTIRIEMHCLILIWSKFEISKYRSAGPCNVRYIPTSKFFAFQFFPPKHLTSYKAETFFMLLLVYFFTPSFIDAVWYTGMVDIFSCFFWFSIGVLFDASLIDAVKYIDMVEISSWYFWFTIFTFLWVYFFHPHSLMLWSI